MLCRRNWVFQAWVEVRTAVVLNQGDETKEAAMPNWPPQWKSKLRLASDRLTNCHHGVEADFWAPLYVIPRSSWVGELRVRETTETVVRRVQDRLIQNTAPWTLFCYVVIRFSLFDVLLRKFGKTVKKLKWSLNLEIIKFCIFFLKCGRAAVCY